MGHNGSPEEFWGGAHKCLFRRPQAVLLRVNLSPLPRSSEARPNRDPTARWTRPLADSVTYMRSHIGLDDFPADVARSFPSDVREAINRRGRAGAAIRLYRRRGWNDSAVLLQYRRASADLQAALDRWEHDEQNPSLF